MKPILFLTCVFLFMAAAARECQAQNAAIYICTLERPSGTLTNVQLQLLANKTCTIIGLGGPASGVPPQAGTWDQKQLVRTFSLMNSSNQYVGTINRGVVRGTFRNYITGDTGTLDAEP
jgi:hypothetical protein